MNQSQKLIAEFFTTYDPDHARYLLRHIIKTADSTKVWKRTCPANVIYFTDRFQGLIDAAFSIIENRDYHSEVMLDGPYSPELWMLTRYETYCGQQPSCTPWDFFPRQLTPEEFTDPYRALRKFARYRSSSQWKEIIKELCLHALSPVSIHAFNDGMGMISASQHLHKLLEATHLIAVRTDNEEKQPRKKWENIEHVRRGKGETSSRQRCGSSK